MAAFTEDALQPDYTSLMVLEFWNRREVRVGRGAAAVTMPSPDMHRSAALSVTIAFGGAFRGSESGYN